MLLSENVKKSYEAFWNHEANGRACLYLVAPKDDQDHLPMPEDITDRWENLEILKKLAFHEIENTTYFADAFPSYFINFGPGCFTAMIGGSYRLAPHTVWFENEPFFIQNFNKLPAFRLNKESPMYQLVDRFTEEFLRSGHDKVITSITDIGGTYDILAALRGTQNLLMDLYDSPMEVKKAVHSIQVLWKEYYQYYEQLLLTRQGGMSSWMPIYSEKGYYPLQCDFSAMISPDMFKEFVLPDLQYQTEYLERSIYHLDGPGEVPHLDHILSLPRLSAIQWTPGDGAASLTDECWYELYQRIQVAGKSLVLLGCEPEGCEKLLKHISTKGLYISCYADDEQEAKEIECLFDAVGVK